MKKQKVQVPLGPLLKNKTYELKRSIVCFENLFIALLNSFSKCTFVVCNVWYNAYKVCFFFEEALKNFVIYKQFLSLSFASVIPQRAMTQLL